MSKITYIRNYSKYKQLLREVPYVNNEKHGVAKLWWTNGQIQREMPYENNLRHGLIRWWDENGQLEGEMTYVNGKRHGIHKWLSPHGVIRLNVFNNNSHLMSVVLISNLLHPTRKIRFK